MDSADSKALPTRLSRRDALAGLAGGALLGTGVPANAGSHAGTLNLSHPQQLFNAYRKLRVSMNQNPVFWWMRAAKFGVAGGKATPLYNMEIGVIFEVVDNRPDSFAMRSLEMVYTTDP